MNIENLSEERLKNYIQTQIDEAFKKYNEYNAINQNIKFETFKPCDINENKPLSTNECEVKEDNVSVKKPKTKLGPFTDYDNYNSLVKEKLGPNENELYGQKEIKSPEQMRREDIWNLNYLQKISDSMKKLLEQEYNHYYGDVQCYIADENKLFNNFINHLTEEDLIMLIDNININLPNNILLNIQNIINDVHRKWNDSNNLTTYDISRNAYYNIIKIILRYKYNEIINIDKPDDDTYFEQMLIAEFYQNLDIIIEIIIKKYNRELFDYLFEKTYYMVDDDRKK